MMTKTLDEMTNEEFEEYLKDKYGPNWLCVALTDEEYDRVEPIAPEKIREALKKGVEEYRKACENKNCVGVDPRLRFR